MFHEKPRSTVERQEATQQDANLKKKSTISTLHYKCENILCKAIKYIHIIGTNRIRSI